MNVREGHEDDHDAPILYSSNSHTHALVTIIIPIDMRTHHTFGSAMLSIPNLIIWSSDNHFESDYY